MGQMKVPIGPALRVLGGVLVLASLPFPPINHGAGVTLTGAANTSLVIAAAFMLAGGIAARVGARQAPA